MIIPDRCGEHCRRRCGGRASESAQDNLIAPSLLLWPAKLIGCSRSVIILVDQAALMEKGTGCFQNLSA